MKIIRLDYDGNVSAFNSLFEMRIRELRRQNRKLITFNSLFEMLVAYLP